MKENDLKSKLETLISQYTFEKGQAQDRMHECSIRGSWDEARDFDSKAKAYGWFIFDLKDLLKEVKPIFPSIDSIEFLDWLTKNDYHITTNYYLYLKDGKEYDKDNLYQHYCNIIEFGNKSLN